MLTQVLGKVLIENLFVGTTPIWYVLIFENLLEDTFECANRTSALATYLHLATAMPASELWGRLAAKFLAGSTSGRVFTCVCKFHFLMIHRAHCSMAHDYIFAQGEDDTVQLIPWKLRMAVTY